MDTKTTQVTAAAALRAARALYERGLYLQAWRAAQPAGPLDGWPGFEGQTLALQLAGQLGNQPHAFRLAMRLHRLHPESEEAFCWAVRAVRARRGCFAALDVIRRHGPAEPGAELLALAASTAATLKDLLEADRLLDRAEALAPEDPWIRIERAYALRAADDYAGALAAADEALRLRPGYRTGAEMRAELLVLLGRGDEALAELTEALARFESASLAWDLVQHQEERDDVAGAEATLARIEEWSPLATADFRRFLARRRSDLAWLRGDREATIRLARASENPFHLRLAERLEAGREGPRRVLPVAFVRQHDMTCAPATLTALARYHGALAQHLEVAERICYDGTPDWAERRWAEEQGFRVREFTVTWDAARALIDRGLPFTLTTVEPGSAHLQAVIGYDDGRATLILRDPTYPTRCELAEAGLDEYRSTGPRGMVLVPAAREALLDGVELPDAGSYDLYHRMQTALVDHRREDAEAARAALAEAAPGHRLGLQADRALAGYDADEEARLAATEALLARFPDDVNLRLSKQGSLADLGRELARVEFLRAECARAGHPLLTLVLGEAIRRDARALPEAEKLARAVMGKLPYDAAAYRLLANVAWERGDREEARRAYRVAACLGWGQEHHAESYFQASLAVGRAEEGLEFLRWRVRRLGGLSGQPVTTLYNALDAVERTAEAVSQLAAAVERRPGDGSLLLFAARARATTGAVEEAQALLGRARTAAHPAEVIRTEAWLAERGGEHSVALERWTALAELEPLDMNAIRAATRLLAAAQGEDDAIRALRRRVERFPHHQGLGQLLAIWLREGAPQVAEAEVRRLLAVHPGDAWAWRELAGTLSHQGKTAEALEALGRAEAIDPAAPSLHNVRAAVLVDAGRIDEAKAELRRSLACSADEDWALRRLLELSTSVEERRAHLAAALAELRRQVILGDGLLAYQAHARTVLAPEELLSDLREAHRVRPDLWHTWVALGRQLGHMGALEEARDVLDGAAQRFPLLARVPVEQASVATAMGDRAAARRALERAVALAPGWPEAVADLVSLLQDAGEYATELTVVERALRHTPAEALLHGWRADALRLLGRGAEAREELTRALRLEPGYRWAWDLLVRLCRDAGEEEHPRALAEAIARDRPLETKAWVLVARAARDPEERLAALDRAIQAWPRNLVAWELRVDTLAELRRWDEAAAAARPAPFGPVPPRSLRLRAVRLEDVRAGRARAIEGLRELVRSEPDHVEAWQLLANWEHEARNAAGALAAAEELVRLSPHDAVAHGFRGHALLLAGARQEARAALRKAVELSPEYVWGLQRLLEMALEDRDEEEARRTLALLDRHAEESDARVAAVEVAARFGDEPGARQALALLLRCRERWDEEAVTRALAAAGWSDALDAALAAALADARAAPAAGNLWARRTAAASRWRHGNDVVDGLLAQRPPMPTAVEAAAQWIEALADAQRRRDVARMVRRHRDQLAAEPRLWGEIGYAYSRTRQHARATAWLAGWQHREGVRPWMLANLAGSLRDLGRLEEARRVERAALDLPADGATIWHRVHLDTDGALDGEPPLIEAADLPEEGFLRWLGSLSLALRAAVAAPPREAWRAARPLLAQGRVAYARVAREPFFLRFRRRVLWRIARRRFGWLAPFAFPPMAGWWW